MSSGDDVDSRGLAGLRSGRRLLRRTLTQRSKVLVGPEPSLLVSCIAKGGCMGTFSALTV